MAEIRWDIKRDANIYRQVSDNRIKLWIKTGKIKADEVVVWHINLSGWRKPEELEELIPFFKLYEKTRFRKRERQKSAGRTAPGKKQIKSILLIDDEEELCTLLGDSLSSRGFQVQFAHTKREALKRLNRRLPDLVLLDLRLPDGDGMMILSVLMKMTPAPAVIITTAYGSEETRSEAKRLGASGFLEKPYQEEDVIRMIGNKCLPRESSRAT
ncbi:MAG: response regulator [Candidatus Aminicenantales bacterium]